MTLHLTARSPEDLLALGPVLLGFWPRQAVVMLTFGARRPFHARLDLPPRELQDHATLRELGETLLRPAREQGARGVVFQLVCDDPAEARPVWTTLRAAARRSGIQVVCALWADGRRYQRLDGSGPHQTVPYDVSAHPFVVEAMVEGRLAFASREEMVASLEAVPQAVEAVVACLADAAAEPVPSAVARVSQHVGAGSAPDDAELAGLLVALRVGDARTTLLDLVERSGAEGHVRFWAAVLPRTPEPYVAAVAGALAFAAWQAGDGALAWAAVDRAQRSEPGESFTLLLAELLERAVPPDAWSSAGEAWPA